MSPLFRTFPRLSPIAAALSLALALPLAAHAQAGTSAPAGAEASAPKDLPLTAAERQQFVGTYLISMPGGEGRSMPFRVYEEKGALYGQPQGGEAKRILYQGQNQFRPEREGGAVLTFTVQDGKATRFSVNTPQGVLKAVRETTSGQ